MGCLTGLLCRASFSLRSVLDFPLHILSYPDLLWCSLWYSPTRVLAVCVLVCSCCSAKAQNQGGMNRKLETHLYFFFFLWWIWWYIQLLSFSGSPNSFLPVYFCYLSKRCDSYRSVLPWAEAAFSHGVFLKSIYPLFTVRYLRVAIGTMKPSVCNTLRGVFD